jgi:low affinity Fe/Cu permease
MSLFDRCAHFVARLAGQPGAFALALLVIVIWGAVGPIAGFSDTWQLIINTSTTIVTFLMVFLIQNTQNRDSEAMHLKLDELLRALDKADTRLVDLEERSENELQRLHDHYRELANRAGPAAVDDRGPEPGRSRESSGPDPGRNQSRGGRVKG